MLARLRPCPGWHCDGRRILPAPSSSLYLGAGMRAGRRDRLQLFGRCPECNCKGRSAEPVPAGPAGHHLPHDVAKILQWFVLPLSVFRMVDFNPYNGERVGEAANPGPSGGGSRATDRRRQEQSFDVGRVMTLLQELVNLLGGNGDALSQLSGLISGLSGGTSDSKRDVAVDSPPARQVVVQKSSAEEWQEVRRKRRREGKGQGEGTNRSQPVDPNLATPPPGRAGSAEPSTAAEQPSGRGAHASQSQVHPKLRKQDWTAEILSPTQVYAKLDSGSTALKAVVPVFTREQLEELCTTTAVHNEIAITAVAFGPWGWAKQAIESAEPCKTIVQCLLGTATVSREVRLHRLGKDCPSIKQVVRKATGETKPTDTIVLRFVADARFVTESEFGSLRAKPAATIRSWAAAHAPAEVLTIKDMWGFKVLGDPTSPKATLSGLVRVATRKADVWLALSGRDKWFVENPAARGPVE